MAAAQPQDCRRAAGRLVIRTCLGCHLLNDPDSTVGRTRDGITLGHERDSTRASTRADVSPEYPILRFGRCARFCVSAILPQRRGFLRGLDPVCRPEATIASGPDRDTPPALCRV